MRKNVSLAAMRPGRVTGAAGAFTSAASTGPFPQSTPITGTLSDLAVTFRPRRRLGLIP